MRRWEKPGLARHSLLVDGMSACAQCGLPLGHDVGLCQHHLVASADGWAAVNRIMCDFLHRRKPLPRLRRSEREDDYWPSRGDVA
jgi:hypothetical protein